MEKNIEDIMSKVEENSIQIEEIVNKLVTKYCKEVDAEVKFIKDMLEDEDNPASAEELDEVAMRLPTYLYFLGQAQETFGIREDIAKSTKMEVYNQIHQLTKGTIADKQATAEAGTLYEDMVYKAYQRSCKSVKQKVEAAYELLSSVKKVISRRMGESALSQVDPSRSRGR